MSKVSPSTKLKVLPRGNNREQAIRVVAGGRRISPDVAWLELVEPTTVRRSSLKHADLRQFARLTDDGPEQVVVLVQGYPGKRVVVPAGDASRPSVESDGLQTLVVPLRERSSTRAGIDFSVEYPPWHGSVDTLPLPDPPGVSGGGVWKSLFFGRAPSGHRSRQGSWA